MIKGKSHLLAFSVRLADYTFKFHQRQFDLTLRGEKPVCSRSTPSPSRTFFFCLPAHSLPPPLPLLTPSFPPFRMLGCALRKTRAEGKELEEITAAKNGETPLGVPTLATCIPWGEGEGWRRPGGLDQEGGWSGRQSIERMSAKPLHPALTQFTPRHFLRTAPRIPWRRHHANRQLPAGAALGVFVLLKNGAVIVRACVCVHS